MGRHVNGERIEALNQANGIGFRTILSEHRQPRRARQIVVTRGENGCLLSAEVGRKSRQKLRALIARHENQDRVAARYERYGTVLEFGPAIGLCMKVAYFLQLQGCFLCDRKGRSAPQRDETVLSRDRTGNVRPIEPCCLNQALWQPADCCCQRSLVCPSRNQTQEGRERGDESLRCCHAQFGSRRHWQNDVGGGRKRAVHIVYDCCRQRARRLCGCGRLDEIVTAARLGNCEEELVLEFQVSSVDRRYARRGLSDGNAKMPLNEVFAEARRIRRAAARASHHHAGRAFFERGAKPAYRTSE